MYSRSVKHAFTQLMRLGESATVYAENAPTEAGAKARGDSADEGEASIPEASRGSLSTTSEHLPQDGGDDSIQPVSHYLRLLLDGLADNRVQESLGLAGMGQAGFLRHVGDPLQNVAALSCSNWACYRTNWSHKCAVG
jgi:hypothetical protein